MKPEDVPAAWVEKAGRAIWEHDNGHTTWPPRDPLEIGPSEDAARAALAVAMPLIVAKAFHDAADEAERYAADTYWRGDSPFHADARFHASEHAKRLRAGAAGWLISATEEPT